MTLSLVPVAPNTDPERLAEALAPAFGGDCGPAVEVLTQTLDFLARHPRPDPWGSYLVHEGGSPVGLCAFKAAPDPAGTVEIAYTTFPAHEREGHATAMAAALAAIAVESGARRVIAHTSPRENASNRALRRNGFVFAGETSDPEDGLVWRWEKSR